MIYVKRGAKMSKNYESMSLKEIFLAGKKHSVVVPVHLRGADVANNPKALEEARQYLVSQLNTLYIKMMLKRLLWIAVVVLLVACAILTVTTVHYVQQRPKTVVPAVY
jgi:hypothetical protein